MNIITVKEWNEIADNNYLAYLEAYKNNNVDPMPRNNYNQFIRFEYKYGYVMPGQYPIYNRIKRNLIY